MASLTKKGDRYYATWYDPHTRKKKWASLSVYARLRGLLFPVTTKQHAKNVFEDWKDEGLDKSGPPASLSGLVERYKEHAKKYQTIETQRVNNNRLAIFLRWGQAHNVTHVSDLSVGVIRAFRDGLRCGPTTRHHYIETLRAMLNWAISERIVPSNPAIGIKREPNYNPRPRRAIANDDAAKILTEFPSPDREFCALALLAGLRRSDIVYLTWADVDLKKLTLTIRPKKGFPEYSPKSIRYTGKHDELPIMPELNAILKAWRKASGKVFVFDNGKGGPMFDAESWTRRIKTRMLEFGIKSNIHELRHTAITNWAKRGIHPMALRLLARHSDLATTLKYTHLTTEDLRKEMEAVERS